MKSRKKQQQLLKHTHIPSELWNEIFLRSSPKTLMKFRCICKTWCSLIDSPQFISLHSKLYNNNNSEKPIILLAAERYSRIEFTLHRSDTLRKIVDLVTIPNNSHSISYSIQGICNGLILLTSCINDVSMEDINYILWNPSIRKSLILPAYPSNFSLLAHIHCILGFAPCSNEYKVFAYQFKSNYSYELSIAVYSLNDHIWRIKPDWTDDDGWYVYEALFEKRRVFYEGAFYWIVNDHDKPKQSHILLSFDFEVEAISVMQLPDAVKGSVVRFVFLLGESLAVFAMTSEKSFIWIMEKNSSGGELDLWRLWFISDSNSSRACNLFKPISSKYYEFQSRILYIEKSKEFLTVQRKRYGERLTSYNIISHKIQDLRKCIYGDVSLDTYVESLVLHKGQTLTTSFP